jgi:hypothetical protein
MFKEGPAELLATLGPKISDADEGFAKQKG